MRPATHSAVAVCVVALLLPVLAATAGDTALPEVRRLLAAGDTLAALYQLERCDLEATDDPAWFMLLGKLHRERATIRDRLKSQKVLERARQIYPAHAGVLNELGLTYFSQTFYPDAARAFMAALEIDPNLCIARYRVGVSYYEHWKLRVNAYWDDAAEAATWLESALDCDSTNVDAAVRLVSVLYAAEEPEASVLARRFARRFPETPEFPLLVGAVHFAEDQYLQADSAFQSAMTLLTNEEWLAYNTLDRNTLGYKDLDVYEETAVDRQFVTDRAFWINADMDPTTDQNERFLEHVTRMFKADVFYSHAKVHVAWTRPQIRGWDTERGEFSIKLGWPDRIIASHGGFRSEVWRYDTPGTSLYFPFIDRFANGNLQIPLPEGAKLSYVRHENRITEVLPEWKPIGGAMDVVAFRDNDLAASYLVSVQVNADSLLAHADVASLKRFHLRSRFFDDQWRGEKMFADTLSALEVDRVLGTRHQLYDIINTYKMPFGEYQVATAFEDQDQLTRAVFRGKTSAQRFADDGLQLSDVLYERPSDYGASIKRNGRELRPNPWRTFGEDQRLLAYFEIYNLAMVAGVTDYEITYTIFADPEAPPSVWNRLGRLAGYVFGFDNNTPIVSQTFARAGNSHDEFESIAIDIGELTPGRHRLVVSVVDNLADDAARVGKNFHRVATVVTVRSE